MGFFSDAVMRIEPSATVAISQRARELKRAGRDVIALSAGEPDFDTPQHVKDAALAAMNAGQTKYTNIDGIPELKQAVADKFRRDNGLDVTADDCFVSAGGKQVLFNAFMATLNPGDEVVIPVPYWVSYPDVVRLTGAEPVFARADEKTGFKLTPDALSSALSEKTKWLIVNSPSNPSGAAYTADELQALAEVLRAYPRVHVLTDDIYEKLIYDGGQFATLAEIAPDLRDRCLVLNGVSKSHAMTGWRIGYCTGPRPLLKAMTKLQSQSITNACSIAQWAAVAALNGPQDFMTDWRATFQARRDKVVAGLNAIPGFTSLKPAGAFYVFPSVAGLIGRTSPAGKALATDADIAMALIEEADVALVPGSAFGLPGHLRLSYAASDADLDTALKRMAAFVAAC